jgi:hypothetical protein
MTDRAIPPSLRDGTDQPIFERSAGRHLGLVRKSWCESNDPAFAAKAAEIVGLYLDPPDGALVLAVDEKPSIQALERAAARLL